VQTFFDATTSLTFAEMLYSNTCKNVAQHCQHNCARQENRI